MGAEVYDGSWSLGQRHGDGHHELAGDVYEGAFHAGAMASEDFL
jgi:hypothetical protein